MTSPIVPLPRIPPPVPHQFAKQTAAPIAPPVAVNKTTQAVLKYLLTGDSDAFEHLMAICLTATKGLFIPNPHEELKFVIEQDSRAGTDPAYYHPGRKFYVEDPGDLKEDFIQNFLLDYLEPYRHVTPAELLLLADLGDFKNIGRACRLALLNDLRNCPLCGSRKIRECVQCGRKLSHTEQNAKIKSCPDCGQELKGRGAHLVCPYGCDPVTVRNILAEDHSEDHDADLLQDFVVARKKKDLLRWLEYAQVELEEFGLYEGCHVFAIAFLEGKGKREITPTWSRLYSISYKVARSRRNKFLERIVEHRDSKIVRQLYNAILAASARPVAPTLEIEETPETKAARRAKSEAAKLMAEFYKTVSPELRDEIERETRANWVESFRALDDKERDDLRAATPQIATVADVLAEEENDPALVIADLAPGENVEEYQDS